MVSTTKVPTLYVYMYTVTAVVGDITELFTSLLEPGHIAAFSDDCSSLASHYMNIQVTMATGSIMLLKF